LPAERKKKGRLERKNNDQYRNTSVSEERGGRVKSHHADTLLSKPING